MPETLTRVKQHSAVPHVYMETCTVCGELTLVDCRPRHEEVATEEVMSCHATVFTFDKALYGESDAHCKGESNFSHHVGMTSNSPLPIGI